jgi:hypothetical protein
MIPNYQGASAIEEFGEGGERYIKVYNNTGSTISKGVPKVIVVAVGSQGAVAVPVGAATNAAVKNIIGVPLNDHADATYGVYQIKGLCPYVVTSGTVSANDNLEIINNGAALIDEGTNGGALETTNVVGTAVANVATNVWKVFLHGKPVAIAAT